VRTRVQPWLAQSPGDPNALLWMSMVKQAFGDLEGAYALIQKAAQARPEDAAIQAQLASASGQKAQSASAFNQLSLAREMKKAGEKALALNPKDVETANLMMQFYWMAPGLVGGDKDKARALAAQAEDHVRRRRRDAEFLEHRDEVRVRPVVEHDEAGVYRPGAARELDVHGIGVAAGIVVRLEDRHLMPAGKTPARMKSGHAGSEDPHPH